MRARSRDALGLKVNLLLARDPVTRQAALWDHREVCLAAFDSDPKSGSASRMCDDDEDNNNNKFSGSGFS